MLSPVPDMIDCAFAVSAAMRHRRARHRGAPVPPRLTADDIGDDVLALLEAFGADTTYGPAVLGVSGDGAADVRGLLLHPRLGRDGWWWVGLLFDAGAEWRVWYQRRGRRIGLSSHHP